MKGTEKMSIYDATVNTLEGEPADLTGYRGTRTYIFWAEVYRATATASVLKMGMNR